MRQRFSMIRSAARAGAKTGILCAAVALTLAASADSIKRADLPAIENITLIGVEDGKLKYRTAAGDRTAPLNEIESITIDSVPEFAAGREAFEEGQMRTAQRSFEAVWTGTRVDWIRHYAGYYLAQAFDKRGEPVDAATVYATLASENADLFFLSRPPLESLAEADENQKERIREQVLAVAETARGETRRRLQAYLGAVTGDDEVDLPTNDPDEKARDANEDLRKNAKVLLPESLWKLLDRQGGKEKWVAIAHLSKGDDQAARDAIKPMLDAQGDIAPKLFIYGKALLGLADQAKADGQTEEANKLYRDAGLAFMRVVVHFNRPGQEHPLVYPAQVEVAYLHKQIGREDIFNRILFGSGGSGGVNLVIDDPEAYPYYRKRYYNIIGEEPPDRDQP